MDVLFPLIWVFIRMHVVHDQLEEDELLRDGAKRVVKAEHVVSILSFNARERIQKRKKKNYKSVSVMCPTGHTSNLRVDSVWLAVVTEQNMSRWWGDKEVYIKAWTV